MCGLFGTPFSSFRPVGSKLLVHPEQALNVAFLACPIRNHRIVNSISEFAVAVLAVGDNASQSGCKPFENQLRLLQHVEGVFLLVLVGGSKSAGQRKQSLNR